MPVKKVQIFYASIGSGHLIAARSISQALNEIDPTIEIDLCDIFRKSRGNAIFQEIFAFLPSYMFPELYSYIWKSGSLKWLYELFCKFGPIETSILQSIKTFSPDLIICTHTYPCTVITNWKRTYPGPPVIAVATDQYIHPYWPLRNIDAFVAPNDQMKDELIRRGFDAKKIFPFGIPISPVFSRSVANKRRKKQVTVIVLAGSYRIAPYIIIHNQVKDLLHFLTALSTDKVMWQFVFGAAKKLKAQAQNELADRKDIEIHDFPGNIQKMIAESDIVLTKPGGLTVAEALALQKPIVLLSQGAGQERENTKFVIESGAGILLDKKEDIILFVEELIQNSSQLLHRFNKPPKSLIDSAKRIAKLSLRLMNQ